MKRKNGLLSLVLAAVVTSLCLSASGVYAQPDKVNPKIPVQAQDVQLAKKVQIKGGSGSRKPPKTISQAATGTIGNSDVSMRYAIVIGISDYPGTANDLQFCDDDARDVVDALYGYGFEPANIFSLVDGGASRSKIVETIKAVSALVSNDPNAEVVFYFSGHGGRGKADDFDNEKIDECIWTFEDTSMVPIWDGELAELFSSYTTSRIVLIFDSCYAGGMTDLDSSGRIVAMASTENSLSAEYDGLQNGEFTYHMIQQGMAAGLADTYDSIPGQSDVTVEESWDYARANCSYDSVTMSDAFPDDLLP